jgi:hypothetical protein
LTLGDGTLRLRSDKRPGVGRLRLNVSLGIEIAEILMLGSETVARAERLTLGTTKLDSERLPRLGRLILGREPPGSEI